MTAKARHPLDRPAVKATVALGSGRTSPPCARPATGTILAAVGLNPFRQHRSSPADVIMVAAALLVAVALVAWAVFG